MKSAILLWLTAPCVFAAGDGRTTSGPLARSGAVFGRGIGNIVGMPIEVFTCLGREFETHHWLWPFTYPFRLIHNFFVRSASAATDVLIHPWIVPFTDDISPLTEPMGLPDYPWQVNP